MIDLHDCQPSCYRMVRPGHASSLTTTFKAMDSDGETVIYSKGKRLTREFNHSVKRSDITIIVEANDQLDDNLERAGQQCRRGSFPGPGLVSETTTTGSLRHIVVRDTVNLTDAPRRFGRVRVTSP